MIRSDLRHGRRWAALFMASAMVIVVGSLLPGGLVASVSVFDKLEHFVAYFGLTLIGAGIVMPDRRWAVLLACSVLGVLIEVAQGTLTTTRLADHWDIVANVSGSALALLVAQLGAGEWAVRVERWLSS